tara:strand:+ start:23383 stop:23739 length:357 start_codon:yes stop_codon:yes gene_type:complete
MNIVISSSILSLFLASILITNQQIYDALPIGATEAEVKSYLEEVTRSYRFVPRDSVHAHAESFPWMDSEIGFYSGRIDNVRRKWWAPSFGRILIVRAVISSEKKVARVLIKTLYDGYF